jgi:uncharacterized delta-60 repeat protein
MGFGDRGRAKAFVGDTGGSGGLGFDAGGALYVVGFSCAANSDAFCAYEQLIAKLGDDGQLDAGYGDGGVASIFDSSIDPVAYTGFTAVAPEPDGTVLVGGAPGLPDHGDSAIARLLPDGSPDPAFGGGDGLVETPTPVTDIYPKPSGKILVGGATGDWCCRRAAGQIFGLQRLEPDGSSDPAFAGGGLAHLKRGALTNTTGSFSLLGSGGSIVAGETFGDCRPRHPVADGTCRARLAALRFKPDGIASDSFGRGGPTLRMLGQERQQSGSVPSEGADTVTTPGKLFVAAATPSSGIPITRVLAYSTGGVRIMSFGKRGTVKLPMG